MTNKRDGASATQQGTLRAAVRCAGTGLHNGRPVSLTIHPAAPNTGIVFRRTDAEGRGAIIPANWRHVVDARMCSAIGNAEGVRIATIEHLMAALAGLGVDNARIDIDGAEVPAMDGSAGPFVALIDSVGVERQGVARRAIEVLKTVSVSEGRATAALSPARALTVSFEIEFDNAAISRQARSVKLMNGAFKSELARARTFGFTHEVEALRKAGLARGGSLENAIVIGENGILNADGLRYDDEFVRHKILDCVGDLYLAGAPILGHFHGHRSGHALTHRVLAALFADPTAWRPVSLGRPARRDRQSGWALAAAAG